MKLVQHIIRHWQNSNRCLNSYLIHGRCGCSRHYNSCIYLTKLQTLRCLAELLIYLLYAIPNAYSLQYLLSRYRCSASCCAYRHFLTLQIVQCVYSAICQYNKLHSLWIQCCYSTNVAYWMVFEHIQTFVGIISHIVLYQSCLGISISDSFSVRNASPTCNCFCIYIIRIFIQQFCIFRSQWEINPACSTCINGDGYFLPTTSSIVRVLL